MASTAVAVLALLAASAVLAAPAEPANQDPAAVADSTAQVVDKQPSEALLYEVNPDTAGNKSNRKKKQTTTICVQVGPARQGHTPAVLCGERDDVDEQKRRMEMQRVLQTPVVQVQPQAGYFGSPHMVQIVPAADTNSVTIEAAGQGRAQPLVVGPGPSAAPSFTVITGNSPYFRAADAGQTAAAAPTQAAQTARASEQAEQTASAAAAGENKNNPLSSVFAASAPPLPATEHANKPQARFGGEEQVIVSQQPAGFGFGHGGHGQQVTVIRQEPGGFMNGGASEVDIIRGPSVGYPGPGGHGGFSGTGGYSGPGGYHGQGGFHDQGGYGDHPPMIDMPNYRAAEPEAAAQPAAQSLAQQQQAAAPAASTPTGASQPRTAGLLLQQQPMVVKDVLIPAVGASSLVTAPAARLQPVQAVPVVSMIPGLQQVSVRQSTGQASIPITLNCDLSTLQYRGSPQQLHLDLGGRPSPVIVNARAAEAAAAAAVPPKEAPAAAVDPLKETLGAAMDAAVRNSTVTVNLNGSPVQSGDLAKLQEELATLQQREKMLYETIQTLKAAGQQDHGAAIVGLQAAAEQITKARAAVEQAMLQPSAAPQAMLQPITSFQPKAADAAGFGNMQTLSAAGLQDLMRSASQFRYVVEPDPRPASNIGPSSSVDVGMNPSLGRQGAFPFHPARVSFGGFGNQYQNPYPGDFRAAQEAQPQPQAAQPQPQAAQPQPQAAQPQPQAAQPQPQAAQPQPKAVQPQQQQPLIQPAVANAPASATQQKLLQQLREAQEDVMRARAATLPREEARQATSDPDEFAPTPGYQYLPRAADAAASPSPSPSTSFTLTASPATLSASGPAFMSAPPSPTSPSARKAYWGR